MVSKESRKVWDELSGGSSTSWVWWAAAIIVLIVAFVFVLWLALFILITAFGYFGFEISYWQAFVICLASVVLFGRRVK